jgi:hypothetical protein
MVDVRFEPISGRINGFIKRRRVSLSLEKLISHITKSVVEFYNSFKIHMRLFSLNNRHLYGIVRYLLINIGIDHLCPINTNLPIEQVKSSLQFLLRNHTCYSCYYLTPEIKALEVGCESWTNFQRKHPRSRIFQTNQVEIPD